MTASFLDKLAQARPDPGGGAASAHGAALALAIVKKVVRLELQRRQQQSREERSWKEALEKVERISEALVRLRDEDVQAYFRLTEARTAGGSAELLAAVRQAVNCPVQIIQEAREIMALIEWAGERCRRHLVSDLLVACEFAGAALRGAYHIGCANLPLAPEATARRSLARELAEACQTGFHLFETVMAELAAREDGYDHCG